MIDQQTRQLALRGEYFPEIGDSYCFSPRGNPSARVIDGGTRETIIVSSEKQNYIYWPDEQTRTEYLEIGDGTWMPKEGDLFCSCERADPTNTWPKVRGGRLEQAAFNYTDSGAWVFAPSWEQLDAFIAKRKGEQPKLTTNSVHATLEIAKPQTITICISDEAIERTAKIMHDADYTDGKEPRGERALVMQIVALLHLEATLS